MSRRPGRAEERAGQPASAERVERATPRPAGAPAPGHDSPLAWPVLSKSRHAKAKEAIRGLETRWSIAERMSLLQQDVGGQGKPAKRSAARKPAVRKSGHGKAAAAKTASGAGAA